MTKINSYIKNIELKASKIKLLYWDIYFFVS